MQFWVSDLLSVLSHWLFPVSSYQKVVVRNGSSNPCKLSPTDNTSNVRAIEIHVMNSVGARYVDAWSNNLLVVMTDAASICASNLLPLAVH